MTEAFVVVTAVEVAPRLSTIQSAAIVSRKAFRRQAV